MTATVKTKTAENGLIAVYTALTLNTRADGTSYRAVSELHPDHEVVRGIVYELHDGELPNDWRYDMIYSLAASLVEYSEGQSEEWTIEDYNEYIPELASNLSDDATGVLLEWAKIGSRIGFYDEPIGTTATGIVDLLKMRQKEEIEMMGYNLLFLIGEKLT